MKCETCQKEHNGQYGSGRFCSKKCASSYSTKNKRKEINQKVSKTLTGKGNKKLEKICPYCNKEFIVTWKRRNQKFCSVKCSAHGRFTIELREHMSLMKSISNSKGNNKLISIKNYYTFNNKDIRCDSLKERKSLIDLIKIYGNNIIDINRSNIYIKYEYDNKIKYFNPDFLIDLNDGKKILLECKTKISKNNTNKKIRPLYFLTIDQKKVSMKNYCKDNDMIYCWYDGNFDII